MTDVAEETVDTTEVGTLHKDTLTFTVPQTSPVEAERGTEITKEFSFRQISNEDEALDTIAKNKWNLVKLVNQKLKGDARANSYQNEMVRHKPSTVSADDIKARMVRDFMKLGLAEDVAQRQVESVLAANNG